ncbi:AAA family ATPase [Zobellia nedashkovskayae]|uniref:AAA family ATPase n=1 Tax=Zobellia nedashkovskayae TaxID=2779510 RepID=UPI00188D02FB|nr:ATP-binding protein [Zobellia nedashkovskayae]
MLIEFSVGNFKSIKEIETLSMVTSKLQPKFPHLEVNNVFKIDEDFKLLKSKAIYGANASGKSNFHKALEAFKEIVSSNIGEKNPLSPIVPFKLSTETENEPTFFQIQFLKDNAIYRYGFVADKTQVFSEWLFKKVDREVYLFTREGEESKINKSQFSEGGILKDILKKSTEVLVQDNYLFLSFIAKVLKGKTSSKLVDFLTTKIVMVSGLNSYHNSKSAEKFIENEENKNVLVDLVKAADMGIDDIGYIEVDDDDDEDKSAKNKSVRGNEKESRKIVYAVKKHYDANKKETGDRWMGFAFEESKGTQKMFELSPYIIRALKEGGTLFIDEFDSRFHSLLTKKIVELFNSKSNLKGQLIFITHDTNLLSSKMLRRDQISFTTRDKYGATHFSSLAEFKGVRNSSSYESDYMHGKYGAIPFLDDFEEIFLEEEENA